MEDKYWSDYTIFIKTVEDLTKFSPSDLIDLYTKLVEELENAKNKDILEWIYEDVNEEYTRTKIQTVIESDKLIENLLLDEFCKKINILDQRMGKFLKLPESKS